MFQENSAAGGVEVELDGPLAGDSELKIFSWFLTPLTVVTAVEQVKNLSRTTL
jgi:hypothetical protein